MPGVIALEGIDGAGKSSVWERLRERDVFENVVFTREPSLDTWYGDAVYRSLEDDAADPLAELYLYLADHANHLSSVIQPALQSGQWVVTDRYVGSRCAYQAATLSQAGIFPSVEQAVRYIYSIHKPVSVMPARTVYLDVSPGVSVSRSAEADKFEQKAHLERVVEGYEILETISQTPYCRINTEEHGEEQTGDRVQEMIQSIL